MGAAGLARFELLVGSGDFWDRTEQDIAAARSRVLVQAMTFEGDAAGQGVAQAIASSKAADRRVLVDDYSRHVINDRFLLLSRDAAIAEEAQATWSMFDGLVSSGAGVRVTNPIGRNPLRYPVRNHKKLLVIDDVAWIGGINFSDHNFAWHDMMLRIDDRAVAEWLAAQFQGDWQGKPIYAQASFGPELSICNFDGGSNPSRSQGLLDLFGGAQSSLEVLSAYPTMPFTDAMARAAAGGARVTIHTPRPNNKPVIRDYLMGFAPKAGISLRLIDYMTHVKAALVDDTALVLGSSNFDFVSYRLSSEYVAVLRDESLIEDAKARLFAPAREQGTPMRKGEVGEFTTSKARLVLGVADKALRLLRQGPRIAEWKHPRWQ